MVLIADDDPTIRLLACELLEDAGFQVAEAAGGDEALDAFARLQADVVLLDVMMPRMNGYEVCAHIRGMNGGDHAAIIMITGLDDIQSINRAYEAGATDFITKPINWTILGHRVRYMWRASKARIELEHSEKKNRALIDAMPDLMFHIRQDGVIVDCKIPRQFQSPLPEERLVGKNIEETPFFNPSESVLSLIHQIIRRGGSHSFEHEVKINGNVHSYESRIVSSGEKEVLVIVRDVTERRKAQERIIQLAYHDSLTGLLNIHSFKRQLEKAMERARRYRRLLAVLMLDLDRFKRINDTLGHNIGDLLLKGIADRLNACVRKTDCTARLGGGLDGSHVARLGGDEFMILLSEISSPHDAAKVARRILDALAHPFFLAGHEIVASASIGITLYPCDGDNIDTLLMNADAAMYHVKEQGRNDFQFYAQAMNASAFERLSLENRLRKALERKEFTLLYQPQVDILTDNIVGAEALVRWNSPDAGMVSPNDFIPLAEENGLILPLGEWVLSTACRQNRTWQMDGLPPVRVTVNLSSLQFSQQNLLEVVKRALRETQLDPRHLELEITESSLMQDADSTVRTLNMLKASGIRIALDDFGTGYSSLSYLKRFPLDVLKIDRTFVSNITTDADDAAIATAIIAMGRSLNLSVIAEGVETREQLRFLLERGCHEVQGYVYSPPVSADAFAEILRSGIRVRESGS